jgi:EmrB/QacA subfamily drug resistance transporter
MDTQTASVRPGGHEESDREANYTRRWWILAVLGVAQLMVILDNTIVNIALPTAQHALHFSNADRQWVVTGYSLAFGSLLLLGGRIGDIIGRKRALLIGLIGFAFASALGGASLNFAMLVIARTVQGAFGALLAPSVLALLNTTFTNAQERNKAFAIYGGIAGAGGAIGLLLGGILTSYASWRWTLFVNLAFAALAAAGALLWLKNDKAADRDPLDIPGLLLVTGGLFCLVYGLAHAETTAWSNHFTIGFLILGVVLLAIFAYVETRRRFPLLPPRVVRNRTRGGSLLAMLFASIGIFGVFLFLTYYLQGTLGFSPVKTGVAFLPMVAALAGMAQVSNRYLLPKVGPKVIVPIGLLLDAVAMYLLHLVGLHSSYVSHVLPYIILLGLGFGLSLAPSFSTGTLGLEPHDAGVGSATLNTSQQVGGSIGTALLNTLAAGAASAYLVGKVASPANLRTAALHSYTTAFLWSSLIFVIGAVIAGLVFQRGNLVTLAGNPNRSAEPMTATTGSRAELPATAGPAPAVAEPR